MTEEPKLPEPTERPLQRLDARIAQTRERIEKANKVQAILQKARDDIAALQSS